MDNLSISYEPGDMLINAGDCFPDLEWLCRDFDIIVFFDFCTGLDAAVLHNKLHTVGILPSSKENLVAHRLMEEKVIHAHEFVTSDRFEASTWIVEQPRAQSLLKVGYHASLNNPETATAILGYASAMTMDVVLEEILEIPLVLSAHGTPLYLSLSDVQEEQRASQQFHRGLSRHYKDLKEVLFQIRKEMDGYDIIKVPPIALEILNKADHIEQISEVLLEMRQKYSKIRERFSELDCILRSEDVTLRKKIKTKAKITKSISKLYSTDEFDQITLMTSFGKQMNDLTKIGEIKDGLDPSDINWTKLVGYLIDKADTTYWRFRLRPLHTTKKNYLNVSSAELNRIIRKHFGHDVTNDMINKVKSYTNEIDRILSIINDSQKG